MGDVTACLDPRRIRRIHVLGVCGTGMGTFAGMLRERGFAVSGSDENVYPPMSTALAEWGIPVLQGYRPANLEPAPDLVVVGNVIRRANPEAVAVRQRGILHTSFPAALGALFLRDRVPLVVAGTHGKTTTSSILAWLLAATGQDPGYLVGGIPLNFGRSYACGSGPHFVVEGDEYDTAYFDKKSKFLHYRPDHAILSGIEFDHGDIFRDIDAVTRAFERFVRLLPPTGRLYVCGEEGRARAVAAHAVCDVRTYGFAPDDDVRIVDLVAGPDGATFTLDIRTFRTGDARERLGPVFLPMVGRHNVLNATAALAMAHSLAPTAPLGAALAAFRGVRKRQEPMGVACGVTVIDDFAHHPTAVRETIRAVRQRHPGARLWAVFHPQSNTSRRRIFQEDYVTAFAGADVAVLARVFRKQDSLAADAELDVNKLTRALEAAGVKAFGDLTVDEILKLLLAQLVPGDVVLGMSGRDFEGLHDRLLAGLRERARADADAAGRS